MPSIFDELFGPTLNPWGGSGQASGLFLDQMSAAEAQRQYNAYMPQAVQGIGRPSKPKEKPSENKLLLLLDDE